MPLTSSSPRTAGTPNRRYAGSVLTPGPRRRVGRTLAGVKTAVAGATALVVSDGEDHTRRRRLVQPAFSIRRINGYTDVILEEIDRTLEAWAPGDRIDLHAELRKTVRRIAIRTLFGDRLGDRAE